MALLLLGTVPATHALPDVITHYRGHVGADRIDLVLAHDAAWNAMGGFLLAADHRRIALERTPYAEDAPLVISTEGVGGDLPEAALALRPFGASASQLHGRWVDLRTREARPLDLQRVTRFETGPDTPAFAGDLLQDTPGGDRTFSVHASKPAGAPTGRVDRIEVRDATTGALLQALDGLDLWFGGTGTLEVLQIDGDGIGDVRATGFGDGNRAGPVQYFLSQGGGYRRAPALEALAARGALRFEDGEASLRLSETIDWDDRTCLWEVHRFSGPLTLEHVDSRREAC
ncbi:hypothetical protein [Coralloluteibacterium stylophorae]|uniref:Uncharacterized protein n=1 Tax=Coralloluteibacterium stylophorae TaxID=1776034 RepID=A0A8J7VS37_9GAMM|nr:hypothetical protein [Coralloluteibacterium stylophorae]MBS7456892.1 hypothetical protein [Coralloluteibacterium stylophorae]